MAKSDESAPGKGVRVLIADDDAIARRVFNSCLTEAGYETVVAEDGAQALEMLDESISVALLDLYMPGASGLECLERFREQYPDAQVIMISATGGTEDAVEAMKMGAFQYVTKPVAPDDLVAHVKQAARAVKLTRDNRQLRRAVTMPMSRTRFVAKSPAARKLEKQIEQVAKFDSTVLITGASGTGKTTLARAIHQMGARAKGPFIAISCAALPRDLIEAELFGHERGAFTGAVESRPGRAEMANGGTLFLDEIGDMPLELQPKLLTFLQDRSIQRIGGKEERQIDVRVIAATHQDLKEMCEQRRFREDLYFRLNVLRIHVPTLSERPEDLRELIDQILERLASERGVEPYRLSPEAQQMLMAYNWPGNLRELENVLERATAFSPEGIIEPDSIDLEGVGTGANAESGVMSSLAGMTMADVERRAIVDTLRAVGGNKAAAARSLGVCEKTIYNKIKRLRIEA